MKPLFRRYAWRQITSVALLFVALPVGASVEKFFRVQYGVYKSVGARNDIARFENRDKIDLYFRGWRQSVVAPQKFATMYPFVASPKNPQYHGAYQIAYSRAVGEEVTVIYNRNNGKIFAFDND